jgi:hypothetical protein
MKRAHLTCNAPWSIEMNCDKTGLLARGNNLQVNLHYLYYVRGLSQRRGANIMPQFIRPPHIHHRPIVSDHNITHHYSIRLDREIDVIFFF